MWDILTLFAIRAIFTRPFVSKESLGKRGIGDAPRLGAQLFLKSVEASARRGLLLLRLVSLARRPYGSTLFRRNGSTLTNAQHNEISGRAFVSPFTVHFHFHLPSPQSVKYLLLAFPVGRS
ncbi:MAG: hypothetical protein ACJ8C4_10740 [Gemmataceae bacterium]